MLEATFSLYSSVDKLDVYYVKLKFEYTILGDYRDKKRGFLKVGSDLLEFSFCWFPEVHSSTTEYPLKMSAAVVDEITFGRNSL